MLEDFLSAIIAQIKISRIFYGIPFKWDGKISRLVHDKNKKYLFIYKLGRFIHATYSTFMAISFTHMWITSDTKGGISVRQILSIGWICCHCGSGILNVGVAHKMDHLRQLVNSFVEFEKKLCEDIPERTKCHWVIKVLCYMGCGASLGMPTFIWLMIAVRPCMPPMVGYTVLNCGEIAKFGTISYYLRIPILLFNIFTWYNAFGMAYFLMFPGFYLPVVCMKEHLRMLEKVTLRHCETTQKIITDSAQRATIVKMYRRMQIFEIKLNDCYQTVFLPASLIVAILSSVASLFVAIRMHDTVPISGMGFFTIKLSILFVVMIFMVGSGGAIYAGSEVMISMWKRVEGLERWKGFRRSVSSFRPLKVKFGNYGFFDALTPLILNAFVLETTVNLLLIVE